MLTAKFDRCRTSAAQKSEASKEDTPRSFECWSSLVQDLLCLMRNSTRIHLRKLKLSSFTFEKVKQSSKRCKANLFVAASQSAN